MNQLLKPRNLPLLNYEKYRDVFTFPVQDYYQKIGIDFKKDPFDIIGHDFMDLYFKELPNCRLHVEVKELLKHFKVLEKKQFVLSAMEHQSLEKSLVDFAIRGFFEEVYGIDNHLAAGKMDRAVQMIENHKIPLESALIIGDTLHDLEVANLLGIKAVLIANGHQSRNRLLSSGVEVYDDLNELSSKLS
jgi:phosphoglycolate phosphatase